MDEWFYALNGAQQGPVSKATLMQLLSSGQVPVDSLVWREGMGDWVAASTVPELLPHAAAAGGQYPTAQPMLGYGVGDSSYLPPVQLNYAGFWIRFAGWFIDAIVLGVANWVFGSLMAPLLATATNGKSPAWGLLSVVLTVQISVAWLYVALMQSSTKQATLGQMATNLQVTDLQGRRISFGRATGRYFATIISGLLCYIGGFLFNLWTERKQTLHDLIAGTVVITK
jgi:uncharacterized RDD family membrane protein YckC